MINTIIFDLDGTLIDSLVDLANTVNVILTEKGYPTHTLDEYRYFVGNGVLKLLERALPADHQGDITAVKKRFDEIYGEICLENTKPYPGITKLINTLADQGYNLAGVTNKPQDHAVKIVKTLFPGCFTYIFGSLQNFCDYSTYLRCETNTFKHVVQFSYSMKSFVDSLCCCW